MKTRTAPAATIASDWLPAQFSQPHADHIRIRVPQLPLPFVGSADDSTLGSFWDLPPTGGYFGGYQVGEAMALWWLKDVRNGGGTWGQVGLAAIVESLMFRFSEVGGTAMSLRDHAQHSEAYASFRGQYSGFLNVLSEWLVAAAEKSKALDGIDPAELAQRANNGLSFDSAAYLQWEG